MTFGITFNNQYYSGNNVNGIDYSALQQTAKEIFQNAQAASINTNQVDTSRVNGLRVGLDLYNGKVSPDVAKNISLQNAGQNVFLNTQTLANIQYLNLQAAKAINESTVKTMDGKIHVNVNETVSNSERAYAPLPNATTFFNTSNLSKDSQGGNNPFFSFSGNSSNEESSVEAN